MQQDIVNLLTKANPLSLIVVEKSITKITELIAWRERKVNKYKEVQKGQSRFSIPRYNWSFSFYIPNMNFLSYTVMGIFLTKNVERKKNG